MNEVRSEVRTFVTNIPCNWPDCGGLLVFDPGPDPTSPAGVRREGTNRTETFKFRHTCSVCHKGVWLDERWPKVDYVPVEYEPTHADIVGELGDGD